MRHFWTAFYSYHYSIMTIMMWLTAEDKMMKYKSPVAIIVIRLSQKTCVRNV